ncbi:hypothetical protein DUI70_6737 [Streptomyces albus]|nr:hypothetical protein DUI70_6737 [Streptomyces albus]
MPGLRRSEVAVLADMSVEYYFEAGVSPAGPTCCTWPGPPTGPMPSPDRAAATRQWTPHRNLQ